jgi:glycosyltransferase involved in cell wall biosynthesis
MYLSIVIPIFNEEENIKILYNRIVEVMEKLKKEYEIIFVDDGSVDNSFRILEGIHNRDNKVKVIKFRKNFGQTYALNAGFKQAQGKVIITMDGDLQNDPEDIPRLIEKMKEGYDAVSGWRFNRKDPLSKRIPSKIASWLRQIITKDKIHDSGCTLKAYKRECFENLELYGEMHRFIPTMLKWKGFKVGEIKVRHHPRVHGKTKYGLRRVIRGFIDLINAKFWTDYSTRPLHLFAGIGGFFIVIGMIIVFYKFFIELLYFHKPLDLGPLLMAAVLFIIIGIQFIVMGFLGEIQVRTYYEKTGQKSYTIEKILK